MDLLLCRLVCNLQVSVSPAFSGASPHQQKHSTPSLRLSFHFSRWSPACFVDVLSCVRRLLAPTFTLHGLWVRMPACLRNWNVFAQQKKNTGGLWSPAIRSPSSERHSGPNDGEAFLGFAALGTRRGRFERDEPAPWRRTLQRMFLFTDPFCVHRRQGGRAWMATPTRASSL